VSRRFKRYVTCRGVESISKSDSGIQGIALNPRIVPLIRKGGERKQYARGAGSPFCVSPTRDPAYALLERLFERALARASACASLHIEVLPAAGAA